MFLQKRYNLKKKHVCELEKTEEMVRLLKCFASRGVVKQNARYEILLSMLEELSLYLVKPRCSRFVRTRHYQLLLSKSVNDNA